MEMRFGVSVSWAAVLMMQPLSFSPSRAVRTNRPSYNDKNAFYSTGASAVCTAGAGFGMES